MPLCENCQRPLPASEVCPSCLVAIWDDDMLFVASDEADLEFPAIDIKGYVIHGVIARGGMGIVYRASQQEPKRAVALKVLLDSRFSSQEARQRFEREIQLAARLTHPGIVAVYESGFARKNGIHFYTMELVKDGEEITKYADRHDSTTQEKLALLLQLCEAVDHAHRQGVIHRDLKPSNILVDTNGRVKVMDFGLAKAIDDPQDLTQLSMAGQLLGTPAYMSPEQASGSTEVGTGSDVYSIGVILYELLSGQVPFPSSTGQPPSQMLALLAKIREVPPPALGSEVAANLRAVVNHSLAKEVKDRYPSARALADDLERYLEKQPVLARPLSTWARGRLWLKRHPMQAAIWGLVVLLLLTFAIGGSWTAHRQRVLLDQIAQKEANRRDEWLRQLLELPIEWLPPLVAALRDSGPEVEQMVEKQLSQPGLTEDRERRLRALLCRAEDVPFLNEQLQATTDLPLAKFLTTALAPHAMALIPEWWAFAYDDSSTWEERFRVLIPLAQYDPSSENWRLMRGLLVEIMLYPPHSLTKRERLKDLFDPVRDHVLSELRKRVDANMNVPLRQSKTSAKALLAIFLDNEMDDQVNTLMKSDEDFMIQIKNLRKTPIDALACLHQRLKTLRESEPGTTWLTQVAKKSRLCIAGIQLDFKRRSWGQLRYEMRLRPYIMKRLHLLELPPETLYKQYLKFEKPNQLGIRQAIVELLGKRDKDAFPEEIVDRLLDDQREIIRQRSPFIDARAMVTATWLLRRWK